MSDLEPARDLIGRVARAELGDTVEIALALVVEDVDRRLSTRDARERDGRGALDKAKQEAINASLAGFRFLRERDEARDELAEVKRELGVTKEALRETEDALAELAVKRHLLGTPDEQLLRNSRLRSGLEWVVRNPEADVASYARGVLARDIQ